MKIAHIITNLKLGGPCKVMSENISHLPSSVESHVYYCKDLEGFDNFLNARKLTAGNFRELRNYDVVHSHGLRPDGIAALSAILHRKTVHVSTIHNYVQEEMLNIYGERAARIISPLWIRAWKQLDALAVLTNDSKRYYERWFERESLNVIGNGMDFSLSDKPLKEEDRKSVERLREKYRIIGSNSHVIKRKGLDQVIRAIREMPDYALVVVGDGPYRETLEQFAKEQGVADRCLFLGFRKNAVNFLPYYDLYVMASRDEGFGLALIEGLAFGIPCICSDIPSFREILDSNSGCFFELDNTDSLREAISGAFSRKDELGDNARKLYREKYTGQIMADRYYTLYQNLIHQKGNKGKIR
ncbi:glycosyltransferase involved in cell wall biosynthesis [Kushneria sinocarnis]|uniref:Glycosyltransferase involved in cell wall biosynthesis n=1 Tax=Kushneria sinocarnis TaxID=595502 RepID=A0A420WXW6_9GAMM|nr:glycosyltransferase [Kushneria sinocarnis]RKR06052.1 glycosyltransferase involved in cell wall biosynthesis [Kushneria sinocarnis]